MNAFESISAEYNEWHIASFIVHCQPSAWGYIHAVLANLPSCSIEASDELKGKFVLVAEAASAKQLANLMDEVRITDHVVDAHLVYHQITEKSTLDNCVSENDSHIQN